jgi:leader peptidase (prepilin peptidase) / N-methyltransferase
MIESAFLWTYAAFAALIGACAGSFVNVLIARWPHDASLLPRSHCPSCGAPIRPIDLVPILSWVALRGRCRDCGAAIPATYPLVELLGALLGWLLFVRFFTSFDDLGAPALIAWVVYGIFCLAMVTMAAIDLRHAIIPDQTSTWAIPLGVGGAVALDWIGFTGWPAPGWQQSVLGAAAGGLIMAAFAIVGRLLSGREALGWGDAKIMAMIGSFVGAIPGVWVVLLAGSLLATAIGLLHLVWTRRRAYLPLGPVLGLVSVIYVLYGDTLIPLFLPVALLTNAIP